HQGDLVFLRVPGSGLRHPPVVADCTSVIDHDRGGDIERDQSAVFLGVYDLVESPENVIRSFVWLQRCKKIADIRWQILGRSGQLVPQFVFGWRKGEFDSLQLRPLSSEGGSVTGLVENRTEIVGNVEKGAWQRLGELARELDFANMAAGLRIFIDDIGPRL